jgi:hypothetical protein
VFAPFVLRAKNQCEGRTVLGFRLGNEPSGSSGKVHLARGRRPARVFGRKGKSEVKVTVYGKAGGVMTLIRGARSRCAVYAVGFACFAFAVPAPVAMEASVAQAPATSSAKIWVGRHTEFEECLKTSNVARATSTPIGVTKPLRIFFEPGGICASAVFSSQTPSRASGYLESHLSRIAAYEVDKLLSLDMVPPTVSRTAEGKMGAAQLWVEGAVYHKDLAGQRSPDLDGWNQQVRRWRVFDNLIGEIDRNEGNILVLRDPAWHLVLIDHSRAFTTTTKMVFTMERIDEAFFERVKALDKVTLDASIGKLVLDGSRALLRRRDVIVAHFEKLVKEKGEAAVFVP